MFFRSFLARRSLIAAIEGKPASRTGLAEEERAECFGGSWYRSVAEALLEARSPKGTRIRWESRPPPDMKRPKASILSSRGCYLALEARLREMAWRSLSMTTRKSCNTCVPARGSDTGRPKMTLPATVSSPKVNRQNPYGNSFMVPSASSTGTVPASSIPSTAAISSFTVLPDD